MKLRATLAALALGVTLGVGGVAVAAPSTQPAVDADKTVVSACVIRFSDPDGRPSLLGGSHACVGVKSVSINQHGEVLLTQTVTDPGRNKILFAMCQADETLGGQRGIICGASGGTNTTRFRLYDSELGRQLDLTQRSDRMRIQGETSNLWVSWQHMAGGQ